MLFQAEGVLEYMYNKIRYITETSVTAWDVKCGSQRHPNLVIVICVYCMYANHEKSSLIG